MPAATGAPDLKLLELLCCAHLSGTPLLQQGDEGNWDFEAVLEITLSDQVRFEALLKTLSDVYAVGMVV